MGKVLCRRHGDAGGPLACDHIRASAEEGKPMPQTCAVTLTFGPDIEDTVESIVCDACAKDWGLSDGCSHLYPSGKGSYPDIVPVCVVCYREACAKAGRADKLKVV